MDDFNAYWNYPLITLSTGPQITICQVVLTVLTVIIGITLTWYLQRLVGRQMVKAKVDPNVAQTIQRILLFFKHRV